MMCYKHARQRYLTVGPHGSFFFLQCSRPSILLRLPRHWDGSKCLFHCLDGLNYLTFVLSLLLHVSITFNQYMAEIISHDALVEAEAEGNPIPDPPPIPDFKPSFDRAMWGGVRDLCRRAVMRLYQGCLIVRVGFTRAQALIRNSGPWLRDNLLPKLKDAPKSVVFKQTFSLLMHTQALLYAAEWTVSVIQASYRILYGRETSLKARSIKVIRSVLAQWVRCNVLYIATSFGGAVGVCVCPAVFGMSSGTLLSDLAVGTLLAPVVQLIAGF